MPRKKDDTPEFFEQQDFSVLPAPHAASKSIYLAADAIKRTLKQAGLEAGNGQNQLNESLILNAAITSADLGRSLYRKRIDAEETRVLTWISIAKESAKRTALLNSVNYEKALTPHDLSKIASLSNDTNSLKTIKEYLENEYGIILVTQKYLPSMKMDGCTFRLANGVPVVGITTRYNRYDNFWFTLMHELSHICLHYEKLEVPIVDDLDENDESEIEAEANRLASDSLVPRREWRKIWLAKDDPEQFKTLCKKAGIHPSIPAGMIRFRTQNYKLFTEYTNVVNVREMLGIADD